MAYYELVEDLGKDKAQEAWDAAPKLRYLYGEHTRDGQPMVATFEEFVAEVGEEMARTLWDAAPVKIFMSEHDEDDDEDDMMDEEARLRDYQECAFREYNGAALSIEDLAEVLGSPALNDPQLQATWAAATPMRYMAPAVAPSGIGALATQEQFLVVLGAEQGPGYWEAAPLTVSRYVLDEDTSGDVAAAAAARVAGGGGGGVGGGRSHDSQASVVAVPYREYKGDPISLSQLATQLGVAAGQVLAVDSEPVLAVWNTLLEMRFNTPVEGSGDGTACTYQEFLEDYGEEEGKSRWERAAKDMVLLPESSFTTPREPTEAEPAGGAHARDYAASSKVSE